MNTPIDDFVRIYARSGMIRAHMPGHKGRGDGPERWDITEMTGADSLYEASGIIRESEENASRLFSSGITAHLGAYLSRNSFHFVFSFKDNDSFSVLGLSFNIQ